jgi:signal transduction histidine kinase
VGSDVGSKLAGALRPLAYSLGAAGVLGTLSSLCVVLARGLDPTFMLLGVVGGGGLCVVAALIIDHRPGNAAAWALMTNGVLMAADTMMTAAAATLDPPPGWLYAQILPAELLSAGVPLFLFLFPDGRLPSPRWRPVYAAYLAAWLGLGTAPFLVGWSERSAYLAYVAALDKDLPPGLRDLDRWISLNELVSVPFMVLGICAVVVRARRATPATRARLRLTMLALAFLVGVIIVSSFLPESPVLRVLWVATPVPLCLAIVMAMRDLFEVDRVVRPALARAIALVVVLLVYSVVSVGAGAVLGRMGGSSALPVAVATLAAAAAFRPTVRGVREVIDRLLDVTARRAVRTFLRERQDDPSPTSVDLALRIALNDPLLRLWFASDSGLIDASGRRVELPLPSETRARRTVEAEGRPVAVLDVPASVHEEASAVDAVLAVAQLPIENAALHANLAVHYDEMRAASERIVQAGDAERRRIERDLHDGAQQRLVALTMTLRLAEDRLRASSGEAARVLSDTVDELRATVVELRRLARGLLPPELTDEGLAVAARSLVARTPIPVSLDIGATRFAPSVEATAWFCVSEALANAVKHSRASRIEVIARAQGSVLRVAVRDDGAGGASQALGSGLRGLADRAAALGGRFTVTDAPGGGTLVEMEIPCGS